jgi:hypothetical protein
MKIRLIKDIFPPELDHYKAELLWWLHFYGNVFDLHRWVCMVEFDHIDESEYDNEKIPDETAQRWAGGVVCNGEYRKVSMTVDAEAMALSQKTGGGGADAFARHELIHVMHWRFIWLLDQLSESEHDEDLNKNTVEETCDWIEMLPFWEYLQVNPVILELYSPGRVRYGEKGVYVGPLVPGKGLREHPETIYGHSEAISDRLVAEPPGTPKMGD